MDQELGDRIKDSVKQFTTDGFLVIPNLLSEEEVSKYRRMCESLLAGEVDASNHRHDLGSHAGDGTREMITQIMWPSSHVAQLRQVHYKLEPIAKAILGDDMAFDFDMIISKPAGSLTPTPWHQDESYWLDMPDKRAVSFWLAMQDTHVHNGCMWFVPGSHKRELREHWKVKEGHHANTCNCSESEGIPYPIPAGGCTGHHGRTLHYTRGNSSDKERIAYIVNFRPRSMVIYERENDYDHGLEGLNKIGIPGKD